MNSQPTPTPRTSRSWSDAKGMDKISNWDSEYPYATSYLMDQDDPPTVTLIGAAVDVDGSVWIAADALETSEDNLSGESLDESSQEKLYERTPTLAWGYHGHTGTGTRFRWQFQTVAVDSWSELVRDARLVLSTCNGGLAMTGVVLAGIVGGKPQAAWIKHTDSVVISTDYLFARNGRVAAKAAWIALGMDKTRSISVRDRLVQVMASTIESDKTLGFPISLWHITADKPIVPERIPRTTFFPEVT